MTRIYLAGPMSGIPGFNFPLFHSAARALRAIGYEVISPAETDPPDVQAAALASPDGKYDAAGKVGHETWGDMLARDVKMLADGVERVNPSCAGFIAGEETIREPINGIVFLPDWPKSRGARLEAFVGTLTGKRFFEYDPTTEMAYERVPSWVMGWLFRTEADLNAGVTPA